METKFWVKNLKGRGHLEDQSVGGRMDLRKMGWNLWTEFI
jgi:hypothetical protein